MSNTIAEKMLEDKRKRSPFISLKDKESVEGEILEIKQVKKPGFSGEEVEVLRVIMRVDVGEDIGIMDKNFDNGSGRFLNSFVDSKADIGDYIVISRSGEGPKTDYQVQKLDKKMPDEPDDEIKTEDIPL